MGQAEAEELEGPGEGDTVMYWSRIYYFNVGRFDFG